MFKFYFLDDDIEHNTSFHSNTNTVVRYLYVFITSHDKIYAILYTQRYRQLYIQHLPFLKFKTNEFLLRIMQTQYNNSI
jgi:hypothetical protein